MAIRSMGGAKRGYSGYRSSAKQSYSNFRSANVDFKPTKAVPRHGNQLLRFDSVKYVNDLRQALKAATKEIRDLLQDVIKRNVNSLPLKFNTVKLAGGLETSDAERAAALASSIAVDYLKWKSDDVLETQVKAMENNFKDSHIGWYYEIGTGEYSDASLYSQYGFTRSLGDPNPYRIASVGSSIVSRSKKDGQWKDFGGNIRETGSAIGGVGGTDPPSKKDGTKIAPDKYAEMVSNFRTYIGEDVQAYRWFEKSVEEVRDQVVDIYLKHINDVDITDYIYTNTLKV
ncbi:hypothetical protein SAMN05446037_100687 [Anaerovirgula multivorans]|uniref:Uncharacterized protein n=1 Tax=Anaerovirgula multivorans TaxID=312168 RepID=A0A239CQV1_9FIRM|nr:hypothetical protein [Anaerovirgula multivorans]SNS22128.1 hypothetical protein SAMN05446037_100687 [Anaerovirgula multivorans]